MRRLNRFNVAVSVVLAFVCAVGAFTVEATGASALTLSPASLLLNPSAQPMPVGDLPGWKQIYSEDFGTAVPLGSFPGNVYGSRVGAYPDGWPDTAAKNEGGAGRYFPSKTLSVSNGALNINLHTENGVHMVSAPTPTLPSYGQTYGRYSVRFRSDPLPGYKIAWLLWPDSEKWPDGGEVDFPEGGLDGTISGYAHYADRAGGQDVFEGGTARFTDWHTATIEWIPGKITFLLDGQVFGTSTRGVPTESMHWVLQTETCIGGCQPADSVNGNVQIDWVSVWSYSPNTPGSPVTSPPPGPTTMPTTTQAPTPITSPTSASSPPKVCTMYASPAQPVGAPVPTPTPVAIAVGGKPANGLPACGSSSSVQVSTPPLSPVVVLINLGGNYTRVTLDASFMKVLGALGLTPGGIGTVKADLAAGTLQFPITGGLATYYTPGSRFPNVESKIQHQGSGFSLTAGDKTVGLQNFAIDAGASKLYGDVTLNGALVAAHAYLFFLDVRTLKLLDTTTEPGNGILDGIQVEISPDAAALLNAIFGANAVTDYTFVGVAKINLKVK